jgi:hypothetical protein
MATNYVFGLKVKSVVNPTIKRFLDNLLIVRIDSMVLKDPFPRLVSIEPVSKMLSGCHFDSV